MFLLIIYPIFLLVNTKLSNLFPKLVVTFPLSVFFFANQAVEFAGRPYRSFLVFEITVI